MFRPRTTPLPSHENSNGKPKSGGYGFPTLPEHMTRAVVGDKRNNKNGTSKHRAGPQYQIYDPQSHPTRAEELLAVYGLTQQDLALAFGVSSDTISFWLKKHSEFYEAYRRGVDHFNQGLIENSLVKRATGYDFYELTYEPTMLLDEDGIPTGQRGMGITKAVSKHIPPDPKSIQIFLYNRDRKRWSTPAGEGEGGSGPVNVNIQVNFESADNQHQSQFPSETIISLPES